MSFLVALDAGHGLNTPGKRTPDGIHEWELNDKVRDKVVAFLSDYDVEFIFPDNNEGNVDEGLVTRRTMYVNQKVDAAVSIHHNAFTGNWNNATGVEVYTDKNGTAKDEALAEAIYNRLVTNTGLRGRGIKEANWTVIDQDAVPAVLVEGGFMDSNNDYKVITSDAGQTAYARAVADGLIEFLGLQKKASTPGVKPSSNTPFLVKVDKVKQGDVLNVRKEPNANATKTGSLKYNDPNLYTIVEVRDGWGKLKSGLGWINLYYTKTVAGSATNTPTQTVSPYYPKYTGNSYGIDTVFAAIGVPTTYRGNWKNRKPVAAANGISDYTGAAAQNNRLVSLAKQGKLKKA